MSYFQGKDLELIESLVYNPDIKPSYEFMKDCLVWEDERPDGLTPEGYEKLCDLWIIRSYIHQKIAPPDWGLDPKYFQESWLKATKHNFKWPGFFRLKLSKHDEEYYKKQRFEAFSEYEI